MTLKATKQACLLRMIKVLEPEHFSISEILNVVQCALCLNKYETEQNPPEMDSYPVLPRLQIHLDPDQDGRKKE